jgi:hypothetical protein
MTDAAPQEWPHWRRLQEGTSAVAAAGIALCVLAAFLDPQQFFFAYLMAFLYWTGISLGCMAIWMLYNLTGGAWGFLIRRVLEAASRTLPLVALLFLPVAVGLPYLYLWVNPQQATEYQAWLVEAGAVPADALSEPQRHLLEHRQLPEREKQLLAHKEPYLNVPFFLIRTAVYFLVWLVLAFLLNRWSALQDRDASADLAERFGAVSAPGLVLYGLTMTFAAIDWVMTLEPFWWSTIFGGIVATGQLLPALAFAILVTAGLSYYPPVADVSAPTIWNDLGSLLLAFVMLWTYMMFSQLLLIWSGNLVEEIPWYLIRWMGGWQWVGLLLVVFYFLLPFLVLLSRDIKRFPRRLMVVAGLILVMSFVHQIWMIAPVLSPGRLHVSWMAPAALVTTGALWLTVFVWQLRSRPLVPLHDPVVHAALAHRAEAHHA